MLAQCQTKTNLLTTCDANVATRGAGMTKGQGGHTRRQGHFHFQCIYMYLSLTINCEILHSTFQMHTQLENILICIHMNDY